MKLKRIASLAVSLVLAASVSCATVFAADGKHWTLLSSEQTESESAVSTADESTVETVEASADEKVAEDQEGNELSAAEINVNIKALSEDEVSNALRASGANAVASALYDITITDSNGDKVTVLDGKTVTVTLERPKLDGNVSFKLYHIDGNKAEEVPIKVIDDAIIFSSNSFSPYVLTWKISSGISGTGNPVTGDDFNALPIIIIAGVALAAVVALLIVKKVKGGKDDKDDE